MMIVKRVDPETREIRVEDRDKRDEFGYGIVDYTLPQERFDELDLKPGDKVGLLLVKLP